MKLIAGLGNPGDTYIDSRHNVGFLLIKALARAQAVPLKRSWGTQALCSKTRIGGQITLLAQPLTYMNLSGKAVKALVRKHKIDIKDVLVVVDDLDLELARLKIRPGGSSGGHRGLESVADSLGTNEFARLRIGISRPRKSKDSAEYVLEPFLKKERVLIDEAINEAIECCGIWASRGIDKAMAKFNRRDVKLGDVSLSKREKRPHNSGDNDEQV